MLSVSVKKRATASRHGTVKVERFAPSRFTLFDGPESILQKTEADRRDG
jgi:hypothetical protein